MTTPAHRAKTIAFSFSALLLASASSAFAGDGCVAGFVWRETIPSDHVCVLPSSRAEARSDNASAPERVNQLNHDYGPDTCQGGFVWREAFKGDHVCVLPQVRTRTWNENSLAASRVAYPQVPAPVAAPPVLIEQPGRGGDGSDGIYFDGGRGGRIRIGAGGRGNHHEPPRGRQEEAHHGGGRNHGAGGGHAGGGGHGGGHGGGGHPGGGAAHGGGHGGGGHGGGRHHR